MAPRAQDWSPKKSRQSPLPSEIKDADDVRRFFRWLLYDQGINFHPDGDFNDVVTYGSGGRRVYSRRRAAQLNKLMAQAHQAVPDVYQIAIEESERFDQGRRRG